MINTFAGVLCLAFFAQPEGVPASRESLLKEMKEQSPLTFRIYNNLTVKGVRDRRSTSGKTAHYTLDYSGNGDLQSYQFSKIEERDGEKAYLDRIVLAASPDAHYVCRRQVPDADYYVETNNASFGYFYELRTARMESVMSPCYVGPYALAKLVESPYFQIEKTESLQRDGFDLVRVEFRVVVPPDATRKIMTRMKAIASSNVWNEDAFMMPEPALDTVGWMIVDPHHGYIVHESKVDARLSEDARELHCMSRIEYDLSSSIPVPKTAFVNSYVNSTFTLASFDLAVKPPSYFSLGRLGLGDFPTKKKSNPGNLYLYVFFLAVSMAALTWLFFRSRSRKTQAKAVGGAPS